ncbi:sigma-70 family RNA polymerase sigma factor [Rubeoparvulum massiliense]|uniref:sigma-70 family RNA polymerase sigma factor n=1 Tax=Rubeoparvulum massiliense TaxID=1631346 RepID=UPI00065E52B7|nr:sigma-70 family RNA polymerase sigma factor [Rubeoparvulum massiliense]
MENWKEQAIELEEVWRKYQPLIYASIKRLHIRREREDAYQVAVLALVEAWRRFNPEKGHFGAYAKRYIYGYLLKWIKGEEPWSGYLSIYLQDDQDGEERHTRDRQLACVDEQPSELEAYFEGLSPNERLFVQKIWIEGLKLVELAALKGVSPQTVQTWGKRAKKKIQKQMSFLHKKIGI